MSSLPCASTAQIMVMLPIGTLSTLGYGFTSYNIVHSNIPVGFRHSWRWCYLHGGHRRRPRGEDLPARRSKYKTALGPSLY